MSTRVCKGCGWVFPATQPGKHCRFCKTPFDEVVCRTCGRIVSGDEKVPGRDQCKACHNEEERKHMVKYTAKRDLSFEEALSGWLAKIAAVPKDYPTLTEEQWLAACRHFNGCAQCRSESIEARGFFIPFDLGGRYCDWNVIPLCDKCANELKKCKNPFRLAWVRDNKGRTFVRRDNLQAAIEYLEEKLDDAIRACEESARAEKRD